MHRYFKLDPNLLSITDPNLIAPRTAELFTKWKKVKKAKKKGKEITEDMLMLSAEAQPTDSPLQDAAAAVQTQPEHLPKTIKRFLDELHS